MGGKVGKKLEKNAKKGWKKMQKYWGKIGEKRQNPSPQKWKKKQEKKLRKNGEKVRKN